jgi:HEAT repeat protein
MGLAFDRLSFEAKPAEPMLTRLLTHRSAEVRAQAARCLGPIGPLASAAIPSVRALARDADGSCRAAALRALVLLEADSTAVLPDLQAGLADSAPAVRKVALEAIRILGASASSLADPLLDLLEKTDLDPPAMKEAQGMVFGGGMGDFEPGQIAEALAAVKLPTDAQCTRLADDLIRRRGKMDPKVRGALFDLLRKAGAPAHEAIRRLFRACPPEDQQGSMAVLSAGLWMKPPLDIQPELIERFQALWKETQFAKDPKFAREYYALEGDPMRREKATEFDKQMAGMALGVPALGAGAVPALLRSVKDGKVSADYALAIMTRMVSAGSKAEAEAALPWVIEQLSNPARDRRGIVSALKQIGPPAAAAVPTLERIVADFDYARDGEDMVRNDLAVEAWIALIRITGEQERWLADAEARFLEPVIKAKPDNNQLNLYFARIIDLQLPGIPYLLKMAFHPDAKVARDVRSSLLHAGQYTEGAADLALPVLLRCAAADPEFAGHPYLFEVIARAKREAATAWPAIRQQLERYATQTADATEREKLSQTPSSRYYYDSSHRFVRLLAAAKTIALAGNAEVVPFLLKLYENEPLNPDGVVRPTVLRTLLALGVDPQPLARHWIPILLRHLDEPSAYNSYFSELALFGPHAQLATAELLRRARLYGYGASLRVFDAMKSSNPVVRSFLHVARFRVDSHTWESATQPPEEAP